MFLIMTLLCLSQEFKKQKNIIKWSKGKFLVKIRRKYDRKHIIQNYTNRLNPFNVLMPFTFFSIKYFP